MVFVSAFLVIGIPLGLFVLFALLFLGPKDLVASVVRRGTFIALIVTALVGTLHLGALFFGDAITASFALAPTIPILDIPGLEVPNLTATITRAGAILFGFSVIALALALIGRVFARGEEFQQNSEGLV